MVLDDTLFVPFIPDAKCVLISFSVTMFVSGVVAIEVWETDLPVWAFVLSLLMCAFCPTFFVVRFLPEFNIRWVLAFVYTVPIGVVQAISGQGIPLGVIAELIIGYALPGRPISNIMFKTWGYITMAQALQFTSDFKLGHYMKIPHRPMFFCQVVATIVAGTVQIGVQAWMFSNIEDFCSPDQKDGFICPDYTVFGTASIIVSLSCGTFFLVSIAQCLLLCCSGVLLGHSVCSRTVSFTTASSFFSWPEPLHHYSSGFCIRSLGSIPSSTSTSHSSSPAQATFLPRRLLTSCPGCSSALFLTMLSVGATLAGGPSSTVSFQTFVS